MVKLNREGRIYPSFPREKQRHWLVHLDQSQSPDANPGLLDPHSGSCSDQSPSQLFGPKSSNFICIYQQGY